MYIGANPERITYIRIIYSVHIYMQSVRTAVETRVQFVTRSKIDWPALKNYSNNLLFILLNHRTYKASMNKNLMLKLINNNYLPK